MYLIRKYIGFLALLIVILIVFLFFRDQNMLEEIEEVDETPKELLHKEDMVEAEEAEEATMMIDVKGEVLHPGVYEVEQEARVKDVIDIAGGFTKEADEQQINLAQKVYDEMVINIPKEGEEAVSIPLASSASISTDGKDKIRVNDATQEELESLNGIGAKKAQAIIDYREENGPFQEADELLQVSGIGEKTLEHIREEVIIP